MSLDRIHDVNGLMQFAAQPVIGTTGTATSIASNQYPGGYQFGAYGGGILAGTNSTNGGASVCAPSPRGHATTDYQSFSTTGMITHDNAAMVLVSVSTTGIALNIQQASAHGQLLDLVFIPGTTGSIVSTLNTTGVGGTTTAACAVMDAALTLPRLER
jgi:hypothetical protein